MIKMEEDIEMEVYEMEKQKERRGENKISYKILYYMGGIVLLIVYIYLYTTPLNVIYEY